MAHQYYTGELPKGEIPPDICIEIALWDRFGWGPKDTEVLSFRKLRELFAVLEQQRVSKESIEFKKFSPARHIAVEEKRAIAQMKK